MTWPGGQLFGGYSSPKPSRSAGDLTARVGTPAKFAFGDAGESPRRGELHDRRDIALTQRRGAQVPAHRLGQLSDQLFHRLGGRAHRLSVAVGQQRGGRLGGRDVRRRGGVPVEGRGHELGVERAGHAQRAHPGLRRRVFGELVQRAQPAGGDDLAGGVAVGGDQVELLEACQHLGLVAAEHRGHAGRLVGAGLGHLRAAGGGQRDGVVGGQHTGDRVGGDFADRVAGNDTVLRRRADRAVVSSWCASRVAATISGWAIAVSVISSVEAVVPSRARSRPLACRPRRQAGLRRRAVPATATASPRSATPVRAQVMQSRV